MNAAARPAQFADPRTDDSVGLPAWIYSDADFFELEKRTIFRSSWQLVCHLSDIPQIGDYHCFDLLGESVVVVRSSSSQIRSFHNVCRHRASRLLDGQKGNCGGRITCPYHAWTYAMDGRLIGVPQRETFRDFDASRHGLAEIEQDIFMGFIFVRLESSQSKSASADSDGQEPECSEAHGRARAAPSPGHREGGSAGITQRGERARGEGSPAGTAPGLPGVREMFGPYVDELAAYRMEDLVPQGRVTLRPRPVNWKNVADNYSDGMHINVAHPGLTRLFGHSYGIEAQDWADKMWGVLRDEPSRNWSERRYQQLLPTVDFLPPERQRLWTYFKLWPNVAFDIYPDQIDFMQFVPVSPTETMIREIAYVHPDSRREMRAARYLNWRINRRVNIEDKTLIERVQSGMSSSSYTVGPLSESEVCLRSFTRRMHQFLPQSREHQKPHGSLL